MRSVYGYQLQTGDKILIPGCNGTHSIAALSLTQSGALMGTLQLFTRGGVWIVEPAGMIDLYSDSDPTCTIHRKRLIES